MPPVVSNRDTRAIMSFIFKLYELTHDPLSEADGLHWAADGKFFWIADVRKFAANVLPRYYKHNHYASFIRQLNVYGVYLKVCGADECPGGGRTSERSGRRKPWCVLCVVDLDQMRLEVWLARMHARSTSS